VQLWQDDTNIASGSFGGGSDTVYAIGHHLYGGTWDPASNYYYSSGGYAINSPAQYTANSYNTLLYSYDPDWGWLKVRQNKLEAYRQQGLPDSSRQVITETLNIMGMNWSLQTEYAARMLGTEIGVLPFNYQNVGRMSQISGAGYFVDLYANLTAPINNVGLNYDSSTDWKRVLWSDLFGYFNSSMEHGLIEQLQSSGLVGVSSIKMLQLANADHEAIYMASSTNWFAVQTNLSNYTISDLTNRCISQGFTLLIPQSGDIPVTSSWSGYGFLERQLTSINTPVGFGIFGGFASDPGATVSPSFVDFLDYSQSDFYNSAPVSVPSITGADPVDMADGTFQVEATDLTLGGTEPRGLQFSHYYNSSRRNSNLAGIAPGWLHNYYITLATNSAPQTALCGTTPAQAAALLVATTTASYTYNSAPDPKDWMVTALISKWAIDQITAKAVSISFGNDTIQFIQQPDGTFTPPANCTLTLTQSNRVFALQERHGRVFQFNAAGWCTNIVDQYGKALSLTYGTSNFVTKVTDWKGRSLTFGYNSSPYRLASVTDSTGRKVSLGYSGNDLNFVVDPEGSTNTFLYDTNHQVTATFNALGQLVASNIYNSFGRVTTQYTVGNTNKAWRIFRSDWQTISQDPAGAQHAYFYDDHHRPSAERDALGNLTQSVYDGQDHVVMTVTPLGETNQFIFDGNHNLLATIDPLGYSNQFFYDANNNLLLALDANQNPTTYGYNPQFSLIGQTNGAGDWVALVYNPDGTLKSRTDAGGTTSYGYDATFAQLNSITYPGGLGTESFVNSALGDVTNHVDARGFAMGYQYNNRRQLTNTLAPTNLMVKVKLDAVGNVAGTTDVRGNTTTNIWSATQHLLATLLPGIPAGAPVITNIYDNRDALVQMLDPLRHSVLCTNDLTGRMVSVTDPLQRTTRFAFDADGHSLSTANAANETNRQAWDARGKPVQQTDGAGRCAERVYNGAGNLVILTNRNNNPWQFQYDAANRLVTNTTPLGKTTSFTFNHQGLPATILDPLKQPTSLYYDARGRLTNRTDNVGTTLYALDANNNVTNVTENGLTRAWTYDAYNRASSYTDVYGNLIQYRYDPNGNLTNLIYPGTRSVFYAYDNQNHLTNVTDWAGRKTGIAYDLAGHLISITRPNGSLRSMGYDASGKMTNILEQLSNSLPIAMFRFGWTNSGNISWEFAAPLPHSTTVPTRTMTYDADNRLSTVNGSSVVLDDDGNLTYGPLTNGGFATHVYDARNRLLNVGGVTNIYDSSGNRIGMIYGTNQTVFVVNPNARLPQMLLRIKNGVPTYYIYGAGLLYQVTEAPTATNTLTYHYDYRGSTIALSADNGLVTDRMEYAAYGLTTYRVGTNDTPFLFNGRYGVESDATGLLNMRARYYNPYLCRFVSADPSGFSGGLNWYAYANGNPVSYLDPFGLGAVGDNDGDIRFSGPLGGFDSPEPSSSLSGGELAEAGIMIALSVLTDTEGALPEELEAAGLTDGAAGGIAKVPLPGDLEFIGPMPAAETTAADTAPFAGQKLYRVYGGDSAAGGASWSPVNPGSVANYRDVAGLPSGGASGFNNSGRFVIEGTLQDPAGVVNVRSALPLDGNSGGILEYIIPNWQKTGAIQVNRVSGVNPEF